MRLSNHINCLNEFSELPYDTIYSYFLLFLYYPMINCLNEFSEFSIFISLFQQTEKHHTNLMNYFNFFLCQIEPII